MCVKLNVKKRYTHIWSKFSLDLLSRIWIFTYNL